MAILTRSRVRLWVVSVLAIQTVFVLHQFLFMSAMETSTTVERENEAHEKRDEEEGTGARSGRGLRRDGGQTGSETDKAGGRGGGEGGRDNHNIPKNLSEDSLRPNTRSQDALLFKPQVPTPLPPVLDLSVLNDTGTEHAQRLQRLEATCRGHAGAEGVEGAVERVFHWERRQVAYCVTHKVASTWWTRVFRWLHGDSRQGHVHSPLDISKLDAHLLPLKSLKVRDVRKPSDSALVDQSRFRFLFTREPYARLWSVFIDKFLLPDNYFWSYYSPRVRASVHGPSKTQERCLNVTFPEFLRYIVNEAESQGGRSLDDHFRPVHYGCNPCLFKPHFVGKVETMAADNAVVLEAMGQDALLRELKDVRHVQSEVDTLVDFNFELVVRMRLQRTCVSDLDLQRRLLTAFLYNGYVAENDVAELTRREGQPLGQEALKRAVLDLYDRANRTSQDVRRQRQKYKLEAYSQVPLPVLQSLQKIFHWDFELFGYPPSPSEIFERG